MFNTIGADNLTTPNKLAITLVLDGFVLNHVSPSTTESVAIALCVRGVPHVALPARRPHSAELRIRFAKRRRLLRIHQLRTAHFVQRRSRIVGRIVDH
jgi:hypothetical protein